MEMLLLKGGFGEGAWGGGTPDVCVLCLLGAVLRFRERGQSECFPTAMGSEWERNSCMC